MKGRVLGAPTVSVSKNQILTALNKPDHFVLSLVSVDGDETEVRYLTQPFQVTEDSLFGVTSVTFDLADLWERGAPPEPPERPSVEYWIEVMVERLASQFSPQEILLFGSHARDDAENGSDIDLLVVMPEVEDRGAAAVEMRRALSDLPVAKDIVVTTPDEIERRGELVGHRSCDPPFARGRWCMAADEVSAEASRWLGLAEDDLRAAKATAEASEFRPRHTCWYSQQAAEKAIKAVLVFEQVDVPKSHDLDQLRGLVPLGWNVRQTDADLSSLSRWATDGRYPDTGEPEPRGGHQGARVGERGGGGRRRRDARERVGLTHRTKLIEVALPLEAINRESALRQRRLQPAIRRRSKWWAQRPVAACRAVLFASIVDDPSSRPDEFPTEEDQEKERQRLFRVIEELVKWENTENETDLSRASTEVRNALDGDSLTVVDPFCGSGSVPLEAQRLGLDVNASDLNPVAVLITKALTELPARFLAGGPSIPTQSCAWPLSRGHAPKGWRRTCGGMGAGFSKRLRGKSVACTRQRQASRRKSGPHNRLAVGTDGEMPESRVRVEMPLVRSFALSQRRVGQSPSTRSSIQEPRLSPSVLRPARLRRAPWGEAVPFASLARPQSHWSTCVPRLVPGE